MAVLATSLRLLADSLAGYLLVVALSCSLPLVAHKVGTIASSSSSRISSPPVRIHPSLPDLREFRPLECLALYLAAYPVLAAYRALPQGGNV
eukprot:CAMPEP_0181133476 /NCGR_PEP_ID=MMETSP1071-20121207/31551_1 /TAXON_ID=35127 /ORGANISM="Thalassiosira sp., Strain NH16" /LENGTH=91 /DNA_ID=CAMNT_0023219883 /DNA_START=174 /DNA_END=446 /DNA_ORIENTATION=+